MRNLNHTMERLINRWWKLPILVFSLVVLGLFLYPAYSLAQPVPPRGQSLQMIRPLVPPPEPPVEKEIRENRQAIEKNKRELERRAEVTRIVRYYDRKLAYLRQQWDCFRNCRVINGKVCGETVPTQADPPNYCRQRAQAIKNDIDDIQAETARLEGGKK